MHRTILCTARAALAGAALLLAACAPATVTERNNGGSVKISPRGSLLVELYSNPSTGYAWEIADIDTSLLRLSKTTEVPPPPHNPPIVGAPDTTIFEFQGVARGHTALKLLSRRPGDTASPPAQVYVLDVNID
jgi:inhibitor of cysteine peptidase